MHREKDSTLMFTVPILALPGSAYLLHELHMLSTINIPFKEINNILLIYVL